MCKRIEARTLKYFIYLSCTIILSAGSAFVWIGFFIHSSTYIELLDYSYTGYIVLMCGALLIVVAFIGIVAAWKTNFLLLSVFSVFIIIISTILIIFGGILIHLRKTSSEYLKSESECRKHFEKADDTSILASKVLCKLYCPCNLDESTANDLNIEDFYLGSAENVEECNPCENIQTYEPNVQQELMLWIDEVIGVKVYPTECAVTSEEFKDKYFGNSFKKYFPLISWMESKFKCSGLCTYQKVQFLNAVQHPIPDSACYNHVKNWSNKVFLAYGIVCMALGVYTYSILIFTFCLCFFTKRKFDLPTEVITSPSKSFKM